MEKVCKLNNHLVYVVKIDLENRSLTFHFLIKLVNST